MKNVKAQGAQGDVLFRRVASVPEGAKPLKAEGGQYVVAHSGSSSAWTCPMPPGLSSSG